MAFWFYMFNISAGATIVSICIALIAGIVIPEYRQERTKRNGRTCFLFTALTILFASLCIIASFNVNELTKEINANLESTYNIEFVVVPEDDDLIDVIVDGETKGPYVVQDNTMGTYSDVYIVAPTLGENTCVLLVQNDDGTYTELAVN